jgi:hypothetical protein
MADYPDVYADGMAVTVGPFGITVTLQLSQPAVEPGPHNSPSETVCRLRMSPAFARVIGQAMLDASVQAPPAPTIAGSQGAQH